MSELLTDDDLLDLMELSPSLLAVRYVDLRSAVAELIDRRRTPAPDARREVVEECARVAEKAIRKLHTYGEINCIFFKRDEVEEEIPATIRSLSVQPQAEGEEPSLGRPSTHKRSTAAGRGFEEWWRTGGAASYWLPRVKLAQVAYAAARSSLLKQILLKLGEQARATAVTPGHETGYARKAALETAIAIVRACGSE